MLRATLLNNATTKKIKFKFKMKSIKERLLTCVIGLLAVTLLVELSLQTLSVIYSIQEKIKIGSSKIKDLGDCYKVLCLGDSFTYGLGVPFKENYPSQLETLLNVNNKGKKFVVINYGRLTTNSSILLNKLPFYLEDIKPDIIVLLIGGANEWNYSGYGLYSEGKSKSSFNTLSRTHVYKLIILLSKNIRNKSKKSKYISLSARSNRQLQSDNSLETMQLFKEGINTNSKYSNNYCSLGWAYLHKYDYDKAMQLFKKGIKANARDSRNYDGMGNAYRNQGNYDEAIKWFKKGIKVNPAYEPNYHRISQILYCDIRKYKYNEMIEFLSKSIPSNPIALDFIKMFKKKNNINYEINNWLKTDLENIINICRRQKIAIILQTYPYDFIYGDTIKEVVRKYSIPLVDNYQLFNELVNKGKKIKSYFIPDGHCNAEGYKVIAENVYNTLKVNNLIPK